MAVKVRCPGCEKVLTVPDTARGKAIRCPGCETKVSVPAGKPEAKSKGSSKKSASSAPPDSADAIQSLDLRNLEDSEARICPKCGNDMSFYDEETTECPKCGTDIVSGGLGEKARKRQLKGPDPDKFYATLWGAQWAYVIKNQVLVWRTCGILVAASLGMFLSMFLYLYIAPWPPRAFFALMTCVAGLMMVGWLWFLDQEFIKATLERKEKLKRINLDIFLCGAIGVKWILWQVVVALPVLAVPGLIGWLLTSLGGLPPFVLWICLGLGYVFVLPLLVCASGHMVMPQPESGFMVWKLVPSALKIVKPLAIWTGLFFATLLPAIGCMATAAAVSGPSLSQLAYHMDENTKIARAKDLVEKTIKKEQEEAKKNPYSAMDFYPIAYSTLGLPIGLWFLAIFLMMFPAVYLMRLNGQIVYFFRDALDLQALAREYKYVAKEQVDEEEIKPKTDKQIAMEALAGLLISIILGGVFGTIMGQMNTELGMAMGAVNGVLWGMRLAYNAGMGQLAAAGWEEHPGWGVLLWSIPTLIILAAVGLFLVTFVPALQIVAFIFLGLSVIGNLAAIYFVSKNWEEARAGCMLAAMALASLLLSGVFVIVGMLPSGTWVGVPISEDDEVGQQPPAAVAPENPVPENPVPAAAPEAAGAVPAATEPAAAQPAP